MKHKLPTPGRILILTIAALGILTHAQPAAGNEKSQDKEAAKAYQKAYELILSKDYAKAHRAETPANKPARKKAGQKPRPRKLFGFNENRELNRLPRKIEGLDDEQARLHEKMSETDYYKTDPAEIARDTARTAEIVEEINAAYLRWEELEKLRDG